MKCTEHSTYKGISPTKRDCRNCRLVYTQKQWEKKTDVEIANDLDISLNTVRYTYANELGLSRENNGKSFATFLAKAKTMKEIRDVYGDEAETLLKRNYEGYNLFNQRNRYAQPVYILLPEIKKKVPLKDKEWKYYIPPPEKGLQEPYIMVQLPDFKKEILIAPLFDVHYGHKAHRFEKFLSYIRWIEENDNVYCVIGGDLMENAIDDGRGMMYDQPHSPHSQLDEMTVILSRIAHKCLVATPGNHEERTYKKTGIDIMQVLADRLNIPYFNGPIFLSLSANSNLWNFHIFHGRGNSQTKGGKMNAASRPRKFTNNIHFFLSGHVHDAVAEKETVITPNPVTGKLLYETQWTVICQSFLEWADTYAYRAGYSPPSMGGVAINLKENGEYNASLI